MNAHRSYSRGQRHPIVHPYPHVSGLGFREDLDPLLELRGQLGEGGSLVGTTLILLTGIHLSDRIIRSSASFLCGGLPLVDGDWLSEGREDSSEIDNNE